MKLMYAMVTEERTSDLTNKTEVVSKKVTYDDISVLEATRVLKELDKDWDLTVTVKLKEVPEDSSSAGDGEE